MKHKIDSKAVEAVVSTLQDLISKGEKVTDSDMFKYTKAYTGDVAREQPENNRKAA